MKSIVKIGTRGSALALYQAELFKMKLSNDFPMVRFELVIIKTTGDIRSAGGVRTPLSDDSKTLFTREIEDALLSGAVDLAVHSAKDLAAVMPQGLKIGAVLEREDARDCLVTLKNVSFRQLEAGARVGTSALRRKAQLLRLNHDLAVEDLHGNVDTRIQKLLKGNYDAIVLAYAGLKRLGLTDHVSDIFAEESFLPAPGQGIILCQIRQEDADMEQMLEPVNHKPTLARLICERAFLRRLGGGCQLPCGMLTELKAEKLRVRGVLLLPDGSHFVERELEDDGTDPEETGIELAEIILEEGGRKILHAIEKQQR
jgi:hydroxymethylbilane synthase